MGDQMGELQDMFKKFMGQQMQTNQNLQNVVNKLEVQVGQMEVNPRHQEHAKAVHILRSGKKKLIIKLEMPMKSKKREKT
ncbi:unnamed protein product [Prunus armeniaca]|uniref:Uncharacterized protein n=1 Tax=Prunus armeniaca TaxID=36596 RepID=A0A6J5VYV7_PRUAR|nr:unnamed protein product [Prunus armeniaca]